jgi:cytochrome d ubiquinol oxidase subunit I
VPKLSSLILKHDLDAPLAGLDTIAPRNRPPVEVVFWSFRVMVGLGVLMLRSASASLRARASRKLYDWRWLHASPSSMGPAGSSPSSPAGSRPKSGASRSPSTAAAHRGSVSPLAAPAVGASLVAFVVVYFAVFGMGSWYLLQLMSRAPQPHEPDPPNAPAHAAGITPAPAMTRSRAAGENREGGHG